MIPIQMTGDLYYDENNSCHTLITDEEESGSGRMGALPVSEKRMMILTDYGEYHRVCFLTLHPEFRVHHQECWDC
jgi:hypothetical protein